MDPRTLLKVIVVWIGSFYKVDNDALQITSAVRIVWIAYIAEILIERSNVMFPKNIVCTSIGLIELFGNLNMGYRKNVNMDKKVT